MVSVSVLRQFAGKAKNDSGHGGESDDEQRAATPAWCIAVRGGSVARSLVTQDVIVLDVDSPGADRVDLDDVEEPGGAGLTEREGRGGAALELAVRLPVAGSIYGEKSFAQAAPKQALSLAQDYRQLLDQSLESRAFSDQRLTASRHAAIVAMASSLAEGGGSPRDVIELHVAALTTAMGESGPRRARVYEREGTLLVLEVMGHLAAAYRLRALGPERDGA